MDARVASSAHAQASTGASPIAPIAPRTHVPASVRTALDAVQASIVALWEAIAAEHAPAAAYQLQMTLGQQTIGSITVGEDHVLYGADPAQSPVWLTRLEYRILETLLRSRGGIVPFRRLVEQAWEDPNPEMYEILVPSLKGHICRLRAKLAQLDPHAAALLQTRRTVGYGLLKG